MKYSQWEDIVKSYSTALTFFTNWHANEDLPSNFGSGLIIPGLDSKIKFILYLTETRLFFCRMVISGDTYTMGTWNEVSIV